MTLTVLLLSLAASATFAMSTVLKHRSAEVMPDLDRPDGGLAGRVGGYVKAMTTNPLWLGGLVCDGAALLLQILALSRGALSVVQPILTSALVFAVLFNAWFLRNRPSKRVIAMSVLLVAGLVLFLWASGAAVPKGPDARGRQWPAVIVGVVATLVVIAAVVLARRLGPRRKALMLGIAVAVVYACTAALIKTSTRIFDRGVVDLLLAWQLYLLIVAGALGVVLNQMAFQAAPLTASLPVIAGLDPLLSVVIGRFVYSEPLQGSLQAVILEVLGLMLLVAAVGGLSLVSARDESEAGSANDPNGDVVTGGGATGGAHVAPDPSR